jgi:hypothetical protein
MRRRFTCRSHNLASQYARRRRRSAPLCAAAGPAGLMAPCVVFLRVPVIGSEARQRDACLLAYDPIHFLTNVVHVKPHIFQ